MKKLMIYEIRETWIEKILIEGLRSFGYGKIQFRLNIALGSCGKFYSCYESFKQAGQITEEEYEELDQLHHKVENGLLKLIESLPKKQRAGGWEDTFQSKDEFKE